MNTILTSGVIAACLLAAVWLGMRIPRLLPEHHLSADTKDTVNLAMGLVATMAALSVSAAILLILKMDRPLPGFMQVSRELILHALNLSSERANP